MIDSLKRGIKIGVGLVSKTADEVEAKVMSLAKSKHLPAKKARAVAKDVVKTLKSERKKAEKKLSKDSKAKLKKLREISRKEADRFLAEMVEWQIDFHEKLDEKSDKALLKADQMARKTHDAWKKNFSKKFQKRLEAALSEVLDAGEVTVMKTPAGKKKSTKKKPAVKRKAGKKKVAKKKAKKPAKKKATKPTKRKAKRKK